MFPFPSPTPKRRPSRPRRPCRLNTYCFLFCSEILISRNTNINKQDRVLLLFTKKKKKTKSISTAQSAQSSQSLCFRVTTFPCILPNINYLEVHFVSQERKINQWYNRGPVYTTPNQAVINWHGLKLS